MGASDRFFRRPKRRAGRLLFPSDQTLVDRLVAVDRVFPREVARHSSLHPLRPAFAVLEIALRANDAVPKGLHGGLEEEETVPPAGTRVEVANDLMQSARRTGDRQ